MWETLHKELGRVLEKSTQKITFKFKGDIPEGFEVLKLESSCGCTVPVFDKESGFLKAKYSTGLVPAHLRYKFEYTTKKKIKMTTNIGVFTFTFGATIYIK